ncbi:CBS domain-containing protein [Candidatus Sumerlaeota bacterium]|nr:CBS domain-containing protein [Candidatus Sumerlaeota bacterium]MBI3736577.1 CBS domain-containing protein [Candidatus Sumerlaeota bacterium]
MRISSIAREIVSVTPETTVMEAIDVMNDHEVSAVGVVEDGRMAGIFTLRDVARKVVLVD